MAAPRDPAERDYAQTIATRYWAQGLTLQQIAAQDGVSVRRLRQVMDRWHIPRRSGRQPGSGRAEAMGHVADLLP